MSCFIVVKPEVHSFMNSVFEEMCRYYTLEKEITGECIAAYIRFSL